MRTLPCVNSYEEFEQAEGYPTSGIEAYYARRAWNAALLALRTSHEYVDEYGEPRDVDIHDKLCCLES